MSKIAILSDIHANSVALRAVLNDINDHSVDQIWCLGDLLGYGPDPIGVINLGLGLEGWQAFTRFLPGNHDAFITNQFRPPNAFNPHALFSILVHIGLLQREQNWVGQQMGLAQTPLDWLCAQFNEQSFEPIKDSIENTTIIARHSVLGQVTNSFARYAFPWQFHHLQDLFSDLRPYQDPNQYICYFSGHTHVPLFCTQQGEEITFQDLRFNETQSLQLGINVINVGSVGQPRGEIEGYGIDPTYVIVDCRQATIEFRRVPYSFNPDTLYGLVNNGLDLLDPQDFELAGQELRNHAHNMVEHLKNIMLNKVRIPDWDQMKRIYRPELWGWKALNRPRNRWY